MQNMLILLLLCLPAISAANDSLAISPASSPSLSPASNAGTSSSNSMWIVQGNSTGKLAPTCSDLCVTEFNVEPNFLVVLQPCEGLSASEAWVYDPQSLSITSKIGVSSNVTLCMDASDPRQLQLVSCSGSPSQMWTYDSQTMRFQGGNSTSSGGPPLYLMGQVRHPSYWGSGKNNYSLQLAADNSTDFASVFTILPLINPLVIEPTSYSTSEGQNLIRNGGFEECNYDPGKGFTTIDSTQPLYLCSWYVESNEAEYSGTNLWQPEEGTHSLHLNSAKIAKPASVVQRLSTKVGSNYTIGFYMAGNPEIYCGDTNKTMKVQVMPSSLEEQEIWFDVSEAGSAGEVEYMYVYPMAFTAHGDYINLTFTSLTSGSCGPVIDNISVKEIQGPLPPMINPHESSLIAIGSRSPKMPTYGKVLLALAVAALLIAIASLLMIKVKKALIKKPALGRGSISVRNNSNPAHAAGWWASFKLEQAIDGFDETGSGMMELSWKQIEKATKNFTTIVGEGGFSTVYRAEMADGRVGAVKMEKTRDRSRQIFKQELSILCRLRHPNLVNLIGFCNEREEGILVFEYMAHGSLHHRLHPPAHQGYVALAWKKRMGVAFQVAQALEYLHDVARPAVVHGDIKSANVLLDHHDNAKLCDFGFSSKAGPNSSVFHSTVASVKGSLGYLDPQYLRNGRLSSKSDVYSFGVLLIELVTGLHAFDMHRAEALTSFTAPYVQDMDMMELIVDARLSGKFDRTELRAMCIVARLCVQEDSASRPTMSEVVFQLSSSSASVSSTTIDHAPYEDGNVSSSVSENLEHRLYTSSDSDFVTMKIQSSRAT